MLVPLWPLWTGTSVPWFTDSHWTKTGWSNYLPSFHLWEPSGPAQVGCMRQVLGPGALGRPRGIGWRGRWEGGLGWGIHVTPWLIHVNVWQDPRKCCEVISLQLIKINEKKKRKEKKRNVLATVEIIESWCRKKQISDWVLGLSSL